MNNKPSTLFTPRYFDLFIRDYGMVDEPPYHALMQYAHLVGSILEKQTVEIVGHIRPQENFFNLFKSIAAIYTVAPEAMLRCWPEIDRVSGLHGWKLIPNKRIYRHMSNLIIPTTGINQ